MTATHGSWTVSPDSRISLKTSRIGFVTIHAKAPVLDGTVDIAAGSVTLVFAVAIDQVSTGNPLLDPEVHALVKSGSDGRLVFTGTGGSLEGLSGSATAGTITVPLELSGDPETSADSMDLQISGTTEFNDIHLPLPGMGPLKLLAVAIVGLPPPMRRSANP